MTDTQPVMSGFGPGDQTRLVVAPSWTNPVTGQSYVHYNLETVSPDWSVAEHIGPVKADESFGDVESWTEYLKRYGDSQSVFASWSSWGLAAVLDYHADSANPNRCQWKAAFPFIRSHEWRVWGAFASGAAVAQKAAIEKLEDLGEDIIEPTQADLLLILRSLRANATATAETTLREDGTASVSFSKDTSVASNKAGGVELPPIIRIAIPVLDGDATKFEIKVRMRVSVDDNAHLTFRFSMVNAERVLETVYAERVAEAKELLGDDFPLLRAAG